MNSGNKFTVFQGTVYVELSLLKSTPSTTYKIINNSFLNLGVFIMLVDGIKFINYETMNCFPEGAWLLNLSMNTMK